MAVKASKVVILCLATLIVGLFNFLLFPPIVRQASSSGWAKAVGEITAIDYVRREASQARGSSTYKLELAYDYQVGGQNFSGDRYAWSAFGTSGPAWYREYVKSHPVGSKLPVYYSPETPQDAVLVKGLQATDLMAFLFAGVFNGFLLLGWATICGGLLSKRLQAAVASLGAGLGCLCFPAVFLVGFAYRSRPPMAVMQGVWVAIGLGVAWTVWSTYKNPQYRD